MADATPGSAPSSNRNMMIVLSYLWLLALVPLLTEKDDKEVQWHAKHGMVLMVAELFLWIVDQRGASAPSRSFGCIGLLFTPLLVLGQLHPAYAVHHEGHQRPAVDHPGHQRVRRQVLDAAATRRAVARSMRTDLGGVSCRR